MTIAIVHDYLSQCGGAERVVLRLAAMFPDAPIYTSIYDADRTFAEFSALDIRTSRLQGRIEPARFRSAALRYAGVFRSFDLSSFDTVVVSSSAFAHHVRHPRSFVYCHTPPRFLYDLDAYGRRRAVTALATPVLSGLRRRDRQAASRHLSYAANSAATAARIHSSYGRRADVIHPPLWIAHLPTVALPMPPEPRALVVSRLLPYKRVDVAVRACALAGVPVTVVGEGPEESRLRSERSGRVEFLGRVPDAKLAALFEDHSVVVCPGREDFGYLPVEANYAGRPVVAFATGGALETVEDGITGRLVPDHEVGHWARVLREVHERTWSPSALRSATQRFQATRFDAAVRRWLSSDPGHG